MAQIALLDRRRSMGELSAGLAHEISQPLGAILAHAQVAERSIAVNELNKVQLGQHLENIVSNSRRASKIIERIRLYIGSHKPATSTVDLQELARESCQLLADDLFANGVTLTWDVSPSPVWVSVESIQISQIVVNLVRNAIESVSAGDLRHIHIACTGTGGRALLSIRDSGPGFSANALEHLAEPFFTTKATGLGLGLSISRSIAQLHGGNLAIGNADAPAGALVVLDLPLLDDPKGHVDP